MSTEWFLEYDDTAAEETVRREGGRGSAELFCRYRPGAKGTFRGGVVASGVAEGAEASPPAGTEPVNEE